jgi:mono/diheme cytochrome c family protein
MHWLEPVLRIAITLPPVGVGLSQQPGRGPEEPTIDSAAVARGNQVYRPNCGFCHGLGARGAAGPDLARSLVILEDKGGKALSAFLKSGRPDLGMPAFPGLSPEQSADLATFLHAKIEGSRARGVNHGRSSTTSALA